MILSSWTSPKTEKARDSQIHGKGFFAVQPISKDEVVCVKFGHVIDKRTLEDKQEIVNGAEEQITDSFYIAPLTSEEFEDSMVYMNHSCEPNCGLAGNMVLVAMRDIDAGEELTFDYAILFADPEYELRCNCGNASCRKVMTGNDWKDPALQQKYDGYFAWYIAKKIRDK